MSYVYQSSAKSSATIRLAVLFSHPIQYFAPLLKELAARPEIDLTVYFCSRQGLDVSFDPQFGRAFKWDIPLLEGYRSVFLSNLRRGTEVNGFFRLINPAIVTELIRQRYDVLLVHGYEHLTKWLAFVTSKMVGTRLFLRGESHLDAPRSRPTLLLKKMVLCMLFQLFNGVFYIGTRNKVYYEHYGVDLSRLYYAPYCVDNEFFSNACRSLAPKRKQIRCNWGIDDDRPVILAVGKLIDVKQPLLLLEAHRQVRRRHKCCLLFIGDGPLRRKIEEKMAQEQISDVRITGFVNQSRIPEAYIAGDLLALPSLREPWGLVVNEAMNFGLPIVASDRVGCASDLVHSGENGYVVAHDNLQALVEALENLVVDDARRHQLGQRSLEIISDYTIERCVQNIVAALTARSAK